MLSALIVFKVRLIIFYRRECVNKDVLNVAIDFLITLSLLNNQATANALVITIQLTEKGTILKDTQFRVIEFCMCTHA